MPVRVSWKEINSFIFPTRQLWVGWSLYRFLLKNYKARSTGKITQHGVVLRHSIHHVTKNLQCVLGRSVLTLVPLNQRNTSLFSQNLFTAHLAFTIKLQNRVKHHYSFLQIPPSTHLAALAVKYPRFFAQPSHTSRGDQVSSFSGCSMRRRRGRLMRSAI